MITQMEFVNRLKAWTSPLNWEDILTTELPRLYNYFRYHGLEDSLAEDLSAVTLEKAWRSRDTYRRERGSVSAWLIAIARNVAADHFRSQRIEVGLEEITERASPQPGPEEAFLFEQELERLRRLLSNLPDRERELVALKYGAEQTNRSIAKLTGLSESNVGTILSRVVSSLRAHMEQYE